MYIENNNLIITVIINVNLYSSNTFRIIIYITFVKIRLYIIYNYNIHTHQINEKQSDPNENMRLLLSTQ